MYQAFFGLNDIPFSIAPNPNYLFLSDRHREALVHLSYGLGSTGGFVLLTGEVGTGKTTVSRRLIKQLPETTDTAFILNPSLTEQELLATICDELGLSYPENPSIKQLTDCLSRFLLANHQQQRNTLLIIDEAQHLRPEVLEQLRLLTNLETDTQKLLQVILIGQPELQDLLRQQELRQLAQRITARYHLLPLTEEELKQYVLFRLNVAGRAQPLFSDKAIAALHQVTDGIPRLTNLICDRALMAGFAAQVSEITPNLIDRAASEVLGIEVKTVADHQGVKKAILASCLGFAIIYGVGHYWLSGAEIDAQNAQSKPLAAIAETSSTLPSSTIGTIVTEIAAEESALEETVLEETADEKSKAENAEQALKQLMAQSHDQTMSQAVLLDHWQGKVYQNFDVCQSASLQSLTCLQQQGTWHKLFKQNYPAVVSLIEHDGQFAYATLLKRDNHQLLLQFADQQIWVSQSWFIERFSGHYELIIPESLQSEQSISEHSAPAEWQWLENALAHIEAKPAQKVSSFNNQLKQRLIQFQQQHGLKGDGIAGPQTLTQLGLYLSEVGPRLSAAKG